jgi:hypothetical protein
MKIDSITPDSALPGTPVLIKGDGLDAADKLLFGDEQVPFKVGSTGSIEADVPSGPAPSDAGAGQRSIIFRFPGVLRDARARKGAGRGDLRVFAVERCSRA